MYNIIYYIIHKPPKPVGPTYPSKRNKTSPKSTKLGFLKSPGLFEKTRVFFKKAQWAGLF